MTPVISGSLHKKSVHSILKYYTAGDRQMIRWVNYSDHIKWVYPGDAGHMVFVCLWSVPTQKFEFHSWGEWNVKKQLWEIRTNKYPHHVYEHMAIQWWFDDLASGKYDDC